MGQDIPNLDRINARLNDLETTLNNIIANCQASEKAAAAYAEEAKLASGVAMTSASLSQSYSVNAKDHMQMANNIAAMSRHSSGRV